MAKLGNKKCYSCAELATTQEHVPPKCLFPEKKDSENLDYRKNLIRVPSCELHNNRFHLDDEFLMIVLAHCHRQNEAGELHKSTKVDRAIERSKG